MGARGARVQRPPEVGVSERRGGRSAASEPDPARDARRGPRVPEAQDCRAGGRPRLHRDPALRPDQHPLRARRLEHAGVDRPQPDPQRARLRRRPRDRLRVPVDRPPRRRPRDGRRGAPGARVVLPVLRREPGRVGRALGGRPRRDAARASRPGRAASGGRPARPTRHRRPAPARRHAGRGPGADRARAADQEPRRDRAHALDDPRVRGRDGAHARAVGRRADRAGDLGGAPSREHPLGRRVDRDAAVRRRRPHQPVVPGVLGPRRPARRHAGLRHRPDRAVRLLRRPLAVVDDRPRPDDGRSAHALQRRARADRAQPGPDRAGHGLPRVHGAELADPRPVPGQSLLVPAPRRRAGRRVPGRLRTRGRRRSSCPGGSSRGWCCAPRA